MANKPLAEIIRELVDADRVRLPVHPRLAQQIVACLATDHTETGPVWTLVSRDPAVVGAGLQAVDGERPLGFYEVWAAISANGKRLTMITRELSNQWQQTRDYWRDAKSQEFERTYLEELLAGVDTTVTVIEQLDKLVTRVRQDCE